MRQMPAGQWVAFTASEGDSEIAPEAVLVKGIIESHGRNGRAASRDGQHRRLDCPASDRP